MCLEVYSPTQPVQIPYELERIRFLSPWAIHSRHTLLVRNAGYEPIHRLLALYPRAMVRPELVRTEGGREVWVPSYLPNHAAADTTDRLPELAPFVGRLGGESLYTARIADPNNPVGHLAGIAGYWYPGNIRLGPVRGLTTRCYLLLHSHSYTAWAVTFARPIEPGTAQWVCLELQVNGAGSGIPRTALGPVVFHELASPIDVRRTLSEAVQTSLRDLHTAPADIRRDYVAEHTAAYRRIQLELGLCYERQVDIQYYELCVQTGDPKDLFLLNSGCQGDIRPRSGSPRIGRDPQLDAEFLDEPVYEWKSGSIIEPAHPWRNSGFSVRLTLGYRPPRRRPARKRNA